MAKLIKEIGIKNNEMSYSLVIGLLLKSGMFSDWHRFEYKTNIVESMYGCLGLQVIRGYGTCRHMASFYKDVFDKLGLYNDKLYNYFSEKLGILYIFVLGSNGIRTDLCDISG